MALTQLKAALEQVLQEITPPDETLEVPLDQACGRLLAEDISARRNVPPFDNSAMDGYAIRLADWGKQPLVMNQYIAAGDSPAQFEAETTARIFTGAIIPQGADTVIPQECAAVDTRGRIRFSCAKPKIGANIRRQGEDMRDGQTMARTGDQLKAAHIGVIASLGQTHAKIWETPQVAVLSSGNELAEPGKDAPPGKIYNSNRYLLQALLKDLGCKVIDLGIVIDSADALAEALRRGAQSADFVISSGGVSAGEADYTRDALARVGKLQLWKLAVKPGKPLAYGRIDRAGKPQAAWFFGLPGNPAAVFVTFHLVVRPALRKRQGAKQLHLPALYARADFTWQGAKERAEYLRGKISPCKDGSLRVTVLGRQGSGILSSAKEANCLIEIPAGAEIKPEISLKCLSLTES